MQLWQRQYDYIQEYQKLVYDTYANQGTAFLCTYYNINTTTTVWDNDIILGGAYEKIGDLSGIRWNKYLLLPIYFPEEISTIFDATEIGMNKENETSITIPSIYGITPYANDIIKFDQSYLRSTNDIYPIFSVTGIEISANTNKRFWKLKLSVEQSRTLDEIEIQTDDTFVFFDYDKKIHTLNESISLTKFLQKNKLVSDNLVNLFDQNAGWYLF